MGLFKGMKQSKERQKAKAFYESAANLPADSRETRKLRSVLGNRTSAFIDMTFIDGAQRTEAYAEALAAAKARGGAEPDKPSAPCYREVKTVGGAVWVYLPQSYCDQFFALGSKYQQSVITPAAVLEITETLSKEIAEALLLDHPLTPLQFLAGDSDEEAASDDADADADDTE